MEQIPNNGLTHEQISAEVASIDKRIIEIESQPAAHFESGGNGPDDQTQEVEADTQARENGPEYEMSKLRHRRAELMEILEKLSA